MARVIFLLVAVVSVFQALAAPLHSRAVTSPQCSQFNVYASAAIDEARLSLGSINTGNDIGNARNILQAQLSLLDANTGVTEIADSLLTSAPPAPANASATVVAGLQAALASLNQIFFLADNTTKAAVAAANASMITALDNAQQAVAANCQTTLN
ncbi:hypothetical protein MSAN_00310200 [Mycena sanguinolenta]|uniref:Uncharacterized protein n=1 Tax=Mycena sanguinolenta TaxID=230812 RepID=A0A8H6ZBC7_9AGAR|nr:hypothetical protein MSAN_00310200 [Mycena sanguinolenta]